MNRTLELELLEELLGLDAGKRYFVDPEITASPIERYSCKARFEAESLALFRKFPTIVAHASELRESGSFLTQTLAGLPLLLTRDRQGDVNAFLNVCRHRGARLVGESTGRKHVFSCPYHAWSYDGAGKLVRIPHEESGFPELDRSSHSLCRLPATERFGLIWVVAEPQGQADFDAHLNPLELDFNWFSVDQLTIAATDTFERRANWKLLIEGGIESYHFKVAHRETIGPHFLDNLSSYRKLDVHMRSILPRTTLRSLKEVPRENWVLREHANVLYTVFPLNQFLLMQDHIAWVKFTPLAADRTEIQLTTLAPGSEVVPERLGHWERNHKITMMTLAEDFEINEQVQSGLHSGANQTLTFGRFEGALHHFNTLVEAQLSRDAQ